MDQTEIDGSLERLVVVATEMDAIVSDIGPKLIRLAHLREEGRLIREGLDARPRT